MRKCRMCKSPLTEEQIKKHPRKRYCSSKCSSAYHKVMYRKNNPVSRNNISVGTVGAINEYRVGIDMMEKGYMVFKNMSPNGSADLMSIKNDKVETIQVKTGYYAESGSIVYPKNTELADILAIVLRDKIIYKKQTCEGA